MNKRELLIIMCILTLFGLTSCSRGKEENSALTQRKPKVAVSIPPLKAFASAVCGDKFDIVTVIPKGANPENYEPSPKDEIEINNSEVYFAVGVPAETTSILKRYPKEKIVYLPDYVSKEYKDLKIGNERDPHIWLSPKRAVVMVKTMAEIMGEIDEENKTYYNKNAEQFINQINETDEKIKGIFQKITERDMLVFHPAFGYFANDYDINMYSLEEEGKEATPKHLKELIDLAKSKNIKHIFYQAETSKTQPEVFAKEIDGEAVELSPLSEDYISNLENMALLIKEAMIK